MQKGSIALKLFGFSLAWLIIALAFTAILLSNLYSRSLDNSLSENLEFHLETLVGASLSLENDRLSSNAISDPRFSRPASGFYWQVRDKNNEIINFSPSLVGSVLPIISIPFDNNNRRSVKKLDAFGTNIRMVERSISLDNSKLTIIVTGNLDEIFTQVNRFRSQTLIVLGAVGIMLAIMSAIVARFALKPIERISKAIEAIREGELSRIEGEYPKEIAPLADEVNELLRSNEQIVTRAKNQVGNLAHGLKTPLAVLRNEANLSKTNLAKIVKDEGDKMTNIVSSYLDRAQLSARSAIIGKKTNASKTLERLIRVMAKLHPNCDLEFIKPDSGDIFFRGEESDLEEMVGNLVDNGCKWAKSNIKITLSQGQNKDRLRIIVEDDGGGLTQRQMQLVLRRGVRLDEKAVGSGLGLDIVKELVDIYGGTLNLEQSVLGGVMVKLDLPAIKKRI